MGFLNRMTGLGALAFSVLPLAAQAQTVSNLAALKGLLPVAQLLETPAGKAALAANESVTGDIQNGSANQPLLLPFAQQQTQALKDAFITSANGTELADGLGSKLGGAYQSLAFYKQVSAKDYAYGSVSPTLALLIGATYSFTASDAASGKFFFANATTDGKKPVSPAAKALLAGGTVAIFDKFNGLGVTLPAPCAHEPDKYGDSRPFQTEKSLTQYQDPDYFGVAESNIAYLCGPQQDLQASPSFPSGHTTYGYTESLLFALMVPERYSQMITRAAEYGNDRIVVGAHYAMDVIAGRTLASYDIAHLLANAPGYANETLPAGDNIHRITVKIRLQSQPWHMFSGVIVRAILAASTLPEGKEAAKKVMKAVGDHREEFEFEHHASGPNMDATPAQILARIEAYSGVKLADAFAVPALQTEVKWHAKYARQNGIHVSPTFMIDGLVMPNMGSGDSVEEWISKLPG